MLLSKLLLVSFWAQLFKGMDTKRHPTDKLLSSG